jgi:hypothetical protein
VLGISHAHAYQLVKAGDLPVIRLGAKRVRVPRSRCVDGRRRGLTGAVGRCWLQADRLTDREVLNRIATQPNRQKSERCRPLGASVASGKGRHRIYGEGREHEVAPA